MNFCSLPKGRYDHLDFKSPIMDYFSALLIPKLELFEDKDNSVLISDIYICSENSLSSN